MRVRGLCDSISSSHDNVSNLANLYTYRIFRTPEYKSHLHEGTRRARNRTFAPLSAPLHRTCILGPRMKATAYTYIYNGNLKSAIGALYVIFGHQQSNRARYTHEHTERKMTTPPFCVLFGV